MSQTMEKTFVGFLGLYLFSLPLSISGISLASSLIFLLFLVAVIQMLTSKSREVLSKLKFGNDWAILGFVLIAVVSALTNDPAITDKSYTFAELRWVFFLYGLTFCLKLVPQEEWSKLYRPWLILLAIVGIYGATQMFTGLNLFRGGWGSLPAKGELFRAGGPYNSSMTFAYSIGMAGFLAMGWSFARIKSSWKWIAGAAALFCFFSVFASMTRGAWVALAVGLVSFLFLINKKWAVGATVLMGAVVAGSIALSPPLKTRILSMGDFTNSSNSIRLQLWQANWEIIKDNPWLGVGLGQNKKYLTGQYEKLGFSKHTDYVSHAHNNFIEIFAGTGIFGILCYLVFSVYFMVLAYRLYRRSHPDQNPMMWGLGLGGLFAQLYFHVGGLTEANFIDSEVNHMLVMIWATTAAGYYQLSTLRKKHH